MTERLRFVCNYHIIIHGTVIAPKDKNHEPPQTAGYTQLYGVLGVVQLPLTDPSPLGSVHHPGNYVEYCTIF